MKVRVLRGALFDTSERAAPLTGVASAQVQDGAMKTLLQILVSVILHPIALVLMIVNILGRDDLDGGKKVVWALVGLLWGIGPILYITIGDGALW